MPIWYTFEGKKIKCDPRCVSAVGKICNCPCGGVFHRSAWTGGPQPEEWKGSERAKMIEDLKKTAERLREEAKGGAA